MLVLVAVGCLVVGFCAGFFYGVRCAADSIFENRKRAIKFLSDVDNTIGGERENQN